MGAILQGVFRRQANPTVSVPSPKDGNPDVPYWYDHLASHAHEYAAAGFSHLQLPPVHMTSALHYPVADGYGVFNDYDLGSEQQPTRFGSAERLQRLCAILHANGITPIADWVPHQRSGGRDGVYEYKSATGKPGRFPKGPGCFRRRYIGDPGRVPQDPVPAPWDDFMFGDELCPINSVPQGYVLNGLIDAGDWLYRRLDLGGCRNDDTKGQAFAAVEKWSNSKAMKQGVVIGEYAEGNRDVLAWWVRRLNFRCYTYDFEVKYRVRDMCNNGSRYDMRRLVNSGLASFGWPYSMCSVTFVENADSDTNGFGAVVFSKLLGYAWILTAEGWPSIYYRDYATDDDCYGLKPRIDNLVWVHEHLANGPTIWRHAEYQFVVFERDGKQVGKPGLLVGLNNDVWGGAKTVNVQTNFGPNALLHDYSGHSPDVWTDGNGRATITIPRNDYGRGYVCYAWAGLSQPTARHSWPTTQVFEGADDLDIPPAMPGKNTRVTRVWVAEGEKLSLQVSHPPISGGFLGLTGGSLSVHVIDPKNELHVGGDRYEMTAPATGWHTLYVHCEGNGGPYPYQVTATYKAPQTLKGA